MTIKEIFSRNLNRLMESAEISRTELAEWSGVPLNTIHGYCRGMYMPSIDRAYKIAQVFRVTLDELVREVPKS